MGGIVRKRKDIPENFQDLMAKNPYELERRCKKKT